MGYPFDVRLVSKICRGVEIVLGLLVFALLSRVLDFAGGGDNEPTAFTFLVFCGVWGFVAGIVLLLVELFVPESPQRRIGIHAGDVVTMVFFFAGFIAAAVKVHDGLGKYTCSDFPSGTARELCNDLVASVVFAAFSWVVWLASMALSARPAIDTVMGGGGGASTAPAPSNPPA